MDHALDFDPQLPDLRRVFDRDWVIQLFETQWPPTMPPPAKITACRLQDTKYQPRKRCVTTYELKLETREGGTHQTIGVVEIGPGGTSHRLYNDDPKLPWLQPATEPSGMAARFAELLELEDSAIPVRCAITPVRYRAGARCVFRYDLESAQGARTLFGKLVGQDADRFMDTVTALHQASLASPAMPRVLPPLAYWPAVQMLVQPEVAGRMELNDLGFDPEIGLGARERWLRAAGSCLAGLHGVTGIAGPARTLADDLAELEEYIAPMEIADGELAARYTAAITAIRDRAGTQAELAPVASHGAFRTDQFMIGDDRLVMIDLDGFCWANPARDIGNYLAYLGWKRIRQPQRAELIERAGQLLREGYGAQRALPDARWLAIYESASMLKIAGRRFRSLTTKEWHLIPALLDGAALALE